MYDEHVFASSIRPVSTNKFTLFYYNTSNYNHVLTYNIIDCNGHIAAQSGNEFWTPDLIMFDSFKVKSQDNEVMTILFAKLWLLKYGYSINTNFNKRDINNELNVCNQLHY